MYSTTSDPSDGWSNHWSNAPEIDLDLSLIYNVELDGINTNDYPDFCDAYIIAADYDGREMTEEELDWLCDNHPEFINESVFNYFY